MIDRIALNDALTPFWNEQGLSDEKYDEALNDLVHAVADRIEAATDEDDDEDDPIADDTITDAEYAEFGKRVAARLGSASVWSNSADFLEEFDALAVVHLGTTIGSGSPDLMQFWRERADALGIEHDGEDEDEEYDPFAPHVN